jgi:hypothetical protein
MIATTDYDVVNANQRGLALGLSMEVHRAGCGCPCLLLETHLLIFQAMVSPAKKSELSPDFPPTLLSRAVYEVCDEAKYQDQANDAAYNGSNHCTAETVTR